MFGKRKSIATVKFKQRFTDVKKGLNAAANRIQELVKENDRLRKRCPDRRNDNRQACDRCGLVQHAMDTSKNEPCRRCIAGVEPGEFFVDIPASDIDKRMRGRHPKIFTVCSSCHGVQPWKRVQCLRCRGAVKIYRRGGQTDFDEALTKLSRGNKSLRRVMERKDEKIRGLERQLNNRRMPQWEASEIIQRRADEWARSNTLIEERRTSQRDTDARIRAEARNLGADTFMGFSIADHVEAMDVAEELARSVRKYSPHSHANEIARRFLKLRKPPTPKKVVTRLHCPECEALAGEEGEHGKITYYFCPSYSCGWRCEA